MKDLVIDFINYDIIAIFFLIQPYTQLKFLLIIIWLIFDLIYLYYLEKKENENV